MVTHKWRIYFMAEEQQHNNRFGNFIFTSSLDGRSFVRCCGLCGWREMSSWPLSPSRCNRRWTNSNRDGTINMVLVSTWTWVEVEEEEVEKKELLISSQYIVLPPKRQCWQWMVLGVECNLRPDDGVVERECRWEFVVYLFIIIISRCVVVVPIHLFYLYFFCCSRGVWICLRHPTLLLLFEIEGEIETFHARSVLLADTMAGLSLLRIVSSSTRLLTMEWRDRRRVCTVVQREQKRQMERNNGW